jgi:putative CocE/NonD family hydrolase
MADNKRIDCGNGVTLERGVCFRLSDGTGLISDHYYPPAVEFGSGPHPTLLMRQPYGRDIASTVVYAHPAWFARRGYNVVIQDVRGRGGSEGRFYPFRNEGRDGAETIAWLRLRPESNGRIGMYGFSYQGATQLLAAVERPPGLQCIAPAMTACDLYEGWFYHHGALRLASTLGWGLQMLKEDARHRGLHEASATLELAWSNMAGQATYKPYAEHPAIIDPELPSYVRDWFEQDAPGEYWSSMDVSQRAGDVEIPALHISGWFDTYLEGSIGGFELLRKSAGTQFARDQQYLLAGPWVHIPWGNRVADLALGEAALYDTDAMLLRWFDHWLRDANTFVDEPRVRHFALGVNEWRDADGVNGKSTERLYLRSGGRAESSKGDGSLAYDSAVQEPTDIFIYDPDVPVASPVSMTRASVDQATLELGNNVLVYTGEPLESLLHIFGRARVILYAATSATHADLTAKLVRVLPSGRAEFVCIGIARSTYLFGSNYQPDMVHMWEFALDPISIVFAKGDCIRLEIAGGAFPLYDRNPSNATRPSKMSQWNWDRSTHTIFHDAERASSLQLPIVEAQP